MDDTRFVQMRKISKRYGGVQALLGIDLEIDRGEVVGLVGDNAAGKSTLMKILSGAISFDEGALIIDGKEVRYKNARDARLLGIEMIYQDLALIKCLDVTANMFLGKEMKTGIVGRFMKIRIDNKRMREETLSALERLKIHMNSVRMDASNLSGGQQQSIAIARAVHFNARLVIMDEPTSALSINETEKVLNLVKHLRERGISIIMISHRVQHVFQVSNRIVVLRHGQKVMDSRIDQTSEEQVIRKIVGTEE
jgi:simple sugar transport system ATP-binding protein